MNITEPMFLALTALVDEPRHGYGIVQEVDRLSGGRVQLKIGTLYGVLDRLSEQGLVALDREEVQAGRLRRYYRLTDEGTRALQEEAARLMANATAATARLKARRAAGPLGATAAPLTTAAVSLRTAVTPFRTAAASLRIVAVAAGLRTEGVR
ncbi:PadR family transcriptional regulator [Nonomuraea sp. NPDC050783]|uniref:PadR family transcriptional regulator n=1 Tax=Nonomuraea sp. NPDC050783 TaxID=3154634 RepID=UPI003467B9C4